ncbi:diaminopimelate epimerase [Sphingomonas sp.]
MLLSFIKCHGSGNDFPLIDARTIALDDAQWARVARALADRDGPVGGDGLLLLTGDGDGQRMFNPDGSEAETCLNGLRCTARLGFEVTGRDAMTMRLPASTAEVARAEPLAAGVTTIRTAVADIGLGARSVGLATAIDPLIEARVPELPGERRFTAVAMPNPHLIAFVERIDEDELVALGDWCEAAPPVLPRRANLSFVTVDDGALFVRTYERGVGPTASCGSAMGASMLAAVLTGRITAGAETVVRNRGGLVRASAETVGGARVTIAGNATFLYDATIEVDPASGALGPLTVHHRRADEANAWNAAMSGAMPGD